MSVASNKNTKVVIAALVFVGLLVSFWYTRAQGAQPGTSQQGALRGQAAAADTGALERDSEPDVKATFRKIRSTSSRDRLAALSPPIQMEGESDARFKARVSLVDGFKSWAQEAKVDGDTKQAVMLIMADTHATYKVIFDEANRMIDEEVLEGIENPSTDKEGSATQMILARDLEEETELALKEILTPDQFGQFKDRFGVFSLWALLPLVQVN